MSTIRIDKYQRGQEEMIYQLIKKVYDEYRRLTPPGKNQPAGPAPAGHGETLVKLG